MASPTPNIHVENIGNFGYATFHAYWTVTDADDLDNEVFVDYDTSRSGKHVDTDDAKVRFAVKKIEWNSDGVSADVEFNSFPVGPDSNIISISPGSSGEECFEDRPSGNVTDPNKLSPADIVISTRDALPGSELRVSITFVEKGTVK